MCALDTDLGRQVVAHMAMICTIKPTDWESTMTSVTVFTSMPKDAWDMIPPPTNVTVTPYLRKPTDGPQGHVCQVAKTFILALEA